jgi:hypothetical protein
MAQRLRIFAPVGVIALATLAALVRLADIPPLPEVAPRVFLGGALLELRSDLPGEVPPGAIQVAVHFPDTSRVVAETFRCVLNGKDVTSMLTVESNGAGGSVFPLRVGDNHLRIEVFGHGWWSGRLFEDAIDVTFRSRPPPPLDQA